MWLWGAWCKNDRDDARDLQLARSERRQGESEGVVAPDCGECCGDGKVIVDAGVGVEV